jgi:hypothetical protein
MGNLQRMDDTRNNRKMYEANLHLKRQKGRPKARWKGDIENEIRKKRVVNWREVAQDRDGGRTATSEALIVLA